MYLCEFVIVSNSLQIVMYFQSTGRGFNVKLAFQFALVLAVCIWLLYQIIEIKHSNNIKDVGSLQAEFSKRKRVVILGRKGDKGMYKPDSNDVILEAERKQKDGGGGEDDDEKWGIEYIKGDAETNAKEGKEMETAIIPHDQPSSNSGKNELEMRDMDKEVFSEEENSQRITSSLEEGDEKDLEISIDGDTGSSSIKDKNLLKQGNGTENATNLGLSEVANGFHDENGVPQGGNDLVEFSLAKSRLNQNQF